MVFKDLCVLSIRRVKNYEYHLPDLIVVVTTTVVDDDIDVVGRAVVVVVVEEVVDDVTLKVVIVDDVTVALFEGVDGVTVTMGIPGSSGSKHTCVASVKRKKMNENIEILVRLEISDYL